MTKTGLLSVSLFLFMGCASGPSPTNHLEASTLWFQTAGETRALQYQAYNLATRVLASDLGRKRQKPRAVVVDIDETALNNGPFQGKVVKSGQNYPANWPEWIGLARAEPIPGALNFLNYADKHDVKIFYVTNRKERFKAATLENLKRKKFPQVNAKSVLCRTSSSSKQTRRGNITKKYDVVLLVGDNLADFSELFEKKNIGERAAAVDQERKKFGTEFIVLPNPMYGDWEGAVYNYDFKASNKPEMRRRAITDF